MPDRENASFCRPRLYDKNDPEMEDDVTLLLRAIDAYMEDAMDNGNKEKVTHTANLRRRLIDYAGDDYSDEAGESPVKGAA